MSPKWPAMVASSAEGSRKFSKLTSLARLMENYLPRTFLIYPLTVRDNWKLGYIVRGFIS